MLFNTFSFFVFFAAFFLLYWFVFNRNLKLQNLFVLLGSYIFYLWWDWRFLALIILSSLFTYILGLKIYRYPDQQGKKKLLNLGLAVSVGLLLLFKYTNFFITSIDSVFAMAHLKHHLDTLNIILPLGISFYTFRMLSYLFDIKNGKFKPVNDWVIFFSYISFFPSLISGPIDRPKTLIPQLEKPRTFDYQQGVDGLRQILWGLFKKMVVADSCATIANIPFDNHGLHGAILIEGAFFYTIQIYADFSGYSDMAIGLAKLIGFRTTRNFANPYFSQNIAEFWRKWHISLTSWLTDYVFTPVSVALRDYGKAGSIIAIIVTFLISGLWHGANWTFVIWGFLHGCLFIPLILKGKMNKKKDIAPDKLFPSLPELLNIIRTFIIVMFAFVLFRSDNLTDAFDYYIRMFKLPSHSPFFAVNHWIWIMTIVFVAFMYAMEWIGRFQQHALENINLKWPVVVRWGFYFFAVMLIMVFNGHEQQFIYFKF